MGYDTYGVLLPQPYINRKSSAFRNLELTLWNIPIQDNDNLKKKWRIKTTPDPEAKIEK